MAAADISPAWRENNAPAKTIALAYQWHRVARISAASKAAHQLAISKMAKMAYQAYGVIS